MTWIHRTDEETAKVVEFAVLLDAESGGIAAWRTLQAKGLPLALIERVLLEPSKRRACTSRLLPAVFGACTVQRSPPAD